MKVKKFVAPSMNEAMKMVRAELGRDAVILHSKVVQTGGFFGLFAKKTIEVLAGVDPDPLPLRQPDAAASLTRQPSAAASFAPLPVGRAGGSGSLAREIEEVKALIRQFNARSSSLLYPPPLAEAERRLFRQGMADVYVRQVMDRLLERWYADKDGRSPAAVSAWTKEAVRDLLSTLPFVKTAELKKVYDFAWSDRGLVKTTTLAKMAGRAVLEQGKKRRVHHGRHVPDRRHRPTEDVCRHFARSVGSMLQCRRFSDGEAEIGRLRSRVRRYGWPQLPQPAIRR